MKKDPMYFKGGPLDGLDTPHTCAYIDGEGVPLRWASTGDSKKRRNIGIYVNRRTHYEWRQPT